MEGLRSLLRSCGLALTSDDASFHFFTLHRGIGIGVGSIGPRVSCWDECSMAGGVFDQVAGNGLLFDFFGFLWLPTRCSSRLSCSCLT
jgi:hypothetical protein